MNKQLLDSTTPTQAPPPPSAGREPETSSRARVHTWRKPSPRLPEPQLQPTGEPVWSGVWPRLAQWTAWALLVAGIGVRMAQYLFNQVLTHDEAAIALNIITRSFGELTQPLDHHQAAPVGFLWTVKLCTLVLGESAQALRLVPLAASLAALGVFFVLVRRTLHWPGALVALGFFALSYRLIFYAVEFKQYSSDILVSCLLLLLAERCWRRQWRWRGLVGLALAGAAATWFSLPAIFVLAGIGTSLFLQRWKLGGARHAAQLLPVGAAWLAGFAAHYLFALPADVNDPYLQNFWTGAFLPFPPQGVSDLMTWRSAVLALFQHPVGAAYPVLGLLLAIAGAAWLLRDRRTLAGMLLLTLLAAAGASMLHRYPFAGRLMLFAAPVLMLLIGAGAEALLHREHRGALVAGLVALVLLGQPLATTSASLTLRPRGKFDLRPLLTHLSRNQRPGDVVLTCGGTNTVLAFYARQFGLTDLHYVHVADEGQPNYDPTTYPQVVEALAGRGRVWIVANLHPSSIGVVEHADRDQDWTGVLQRAAELGPQLDEQHTRTSALYLYDLSAAPATAATPTAAPPAARQQ